MNFLQLGLAAPLLKALEGEGYTTPTPIQAKAIPAIITGSDLLGIAQTGTGKTAAFALPIMHRLAANRHPAPRKGCRVLVLSPTRELASQIADSFRVYGRHLNVSVAVVFGGVAHRPQITALSRGVDILVATPGRLIDHLGERNVDLGQTEILVLDEADQMLDLGFLKPIRRIVSHLPLRRQNLFFSATMPAEIAGLADDLLRNPVKITVAPVAATSQLVSQRVIHIEASKKRSLLVALFANPEMNRTLVFTRTKRGADRVARHLEAEGIHSAAIHGNKSQRQREEALQAFRDGKVRVLAATDIAARGIDVDAVSHVVNYELPEVPEAYVHRIGRTARAGATGSAISLCDQTERDLLRGIERLMRLTIPSEDRRNDASIAADKSDRASLGNGEGRGRSSSGGGRRDARPRNGSADPGRGQRRPDARNARSDDRQFGDRPARSQAATTPYRAAAPGGDRSKSDARGPSDPNAGRRQGDASGGARPKAIANGKPPKSPRGWSPRPASTA